MPLIQRKRYHSDDEGEESSSESLASDEDTDLNNDDLPAWLQYVAIFGNSTKSLVASASFLLLAIGIALYIEHFPASYKGLISKFEAYQKLGPIPSLGPAKVFEWNDIFTETDQISQEALDSFDRDGVIAIRGLLDKEILARVGHEASLLMKEEFEKKALKPKGPLTGRKPSNSGTQFFTVKEGMIFHDFKNVTSVDDSTERRTDDQSVPAFLQVALQSRIPHVVAKLMRTSQDETIRLMRDIFLAKDTDEYICGWHVDDTGFWPATAEAPGINAWIALDDMPVQNGGGFALAVGSHDADWRHHAYKVTGSTHTFPPEGFLSAKDIVERRVGNGTCNIEIAAPHLHQRMEDTKRTYDLRRGDVIFHTRWLFHRTVPFVRHVVEHHGRENSNSPLLYKRYSIRYGPGSSVIPKGYGTEPSVLWEPQNAGRTADQVAESDMAWYPKAWPTVDEEEIEQLREIAQHRLPKVSKIADGRKKQMRQVRRAMARGQMQRQPH